YRQNLPECLYSDYIKHEKKFGATVKVLEDPGQETVEPEGYKHWQDYIASIVKFIYMPMNEKLSLVLNVPRNKVSYDPGSNKIDFSFKQFSSEIGNSYLGEIDSISSLDRNCFTDVIVITDAINKKYLEPVKRAFEDTAYTKPIINFVIEKDLTSENLKKKIDEMMAKVIDTLIVFIPMDTFASTTLKDQQMLSERARKCKTDPLWKNNAVLASPPFPSNYGNKKWIKNTTNWIVFSHRVCSVQNLSSEAMTESSERLKQDIERITESSQDPVKEELTSCRKSWCDMLEAMLCIKPSRSTQTLQFREFKKIVLIGDQYVEEELDWKSENTVFVKMSLPLSSTDLAIHSFKMLSKDLLESKNTLFILLTDSTNWLKSTSFCRYMNHRLDEGNHFEGRKMYELTHMLDGNKQDLFRKENTKLYIRKSKEFVQRAHEYIHSQSAIIFTPLIPQWIVCPGMVKDVLSSLHCNIHEMTEKPMFQLFHPKLSSKEVISYLKTMDVCWTECIKKIMEMQQIPSDLVDLYARRRLGNFAIEVNTALACKLRKDKHSAVYSHWQGLIYAYVKIMTKGPESKSFQTVLENKRPKFQRVVFIGNFAQSMVINLKLPNVLGIHEEIDFHTTDLTKNKELMKLLNKKPRETLFIFLITYGCFKANNSIQKKTIMDFSFTWIETENMLKSTQTSEFLKASSFLENFQSQLIGLGSSAIFVPLCPQVFYKYPSNSSQSNEVQEFWTKIKTSSKERHSPLILSSEVKKIFPIESFFSSFYINWMTLVRDILKKNNMLSDVFAESRKFSKCIYGPGSHFTMEKVLNNKFDDHIKFFISKNCCLTKELT
ncbi:unnamed protein product, partial [Meganyctiphanes norvegica]